MLTTCWVLHAWLGWPHSCGIWIRPSPVCLISCPGPDCGVAGVSVLSDDPVHYGTPRAPLVVVKEKVRNGGEG
jgi:hypothetical protein